VNTDDEPSGAVAIIAIRADDRRSMFGRAATRAAAEATIARLRQLDMDAEIGEGVDPYTPPGTAIPPSVANKRSRPARRSA